MYMYYLKQHLFFMILTYYYTEVHIAQIVAHEPWFRECSWVGMLWIPCKVLLSRSAEVAVCLVSAADV